MLEPYQKKILELMLKQELLLAKLYKIFSENFPEKKDVWEQLAHEEQRHAKWIKKLFQAEKKDLVVFDEGKTKTYTMETIIGHLENVLEKVQKGEFTEQLAIGHTLDFERALVEKELFKHFSATDESVRTILLKLEKESQEHMLLLRNLRQT